ncbi:MAG: hypothetical protein GF418_12680 [Chitinivibrionales bacterium]|nr:hypothetical protein [Chitinivibrionales bacterium]MBD3396475.1 hypothetical protein [Chitinivibrionales bacterium]
MRSQPILAALSILIGLAGNAQTLSVDLVTTGAGSWIYIAKDAGSEVLYFNKVPVNAYVSFMGFKAFAGIPLLWSVRTKGGAYDNGLVRLADINLYVGRPVGPLEPRLGVKVPTGYRTDRVWIGSRNVKLQAGLGLNSEVREVGRLNAAGEVMFDLYLPGPNALAMWKSWELLPSFKISFRPVERTRIGLELLASVKSVYWAQDWRETTLGTVPNLYGEFALSDRVYLNLKAGAGPTLKKSPDDARLRHRGNSVNLGIALNIYP